MRISKIPKLSQKKARTNEISFRIRNGRGNLSSQSHQVLRPWTGASAPGPVTHKNGRDDFNKQYQKMEEKALDALTLLNRNLTGVVAQTAPLGQPPKRAPRRAQSRHGRGRNCNFGKTTSQAPPRPATGSTAPGQLCRDLHNKSNESRKSEVPTASQAEKSVNFQEQQADTSAASQP